ncbi:hypothetical protein QOZ96_000968 [Brevundimonas nasdae]|jgi:hypothetical protein|uniref:Tail specific protease domain-containing protein n=2 Tax=Pseudomonadota TaxID=1224 RepID=A0ABX8TNK0_9CAUL|nr:hypothetical protein [Brevundimonas nasdae]MBK6024379.1 hypothetical protein [Brevundimonas nasdae]MDQ0451037.1 hypothetical protein [Brevundimonas nasdae]QYC11657.1 hypothetical protein KWG56_06755 [Brevundimonas nasdae]QYC14443.1 hypothetical protein KWG63_02090 [Brevundimonas nasdae]
MNRMTAAASAAVLALTLAAGAAVAQDFRALAQQDLQAAHDALAANHPAAVIPGPASETFRSWIDAGLQDAQSKAPRVNSGDSHAYLMRYYANGFRDSNIAIRPTYEGLGPFFATGWPGFATAWRNGEYVVSYVKEGVRNAPPLGAVLVSCGDQSAADMASTRLDKWEGDLTTEAGRVRTAPYLLWNRNNPFTGGVPTVQCKFKQGRRDRDYTLASQPADAASLEAAYRASVYTPGSVPLSIETVNGRPWISVHSLADNAGWDAFFAAIEGQLSTIRGPQGFVLDLRGASGESINATSRGYGLANRIWTPEFTVSRQPPAGSITYRATQANRQWYADTLGRMQSDPRFVQESGPVIEQTAAIVAAFDSALAAGQQTFTLPGRPSVPDEGVANPVAGPVVVLVDGGCTSGCLDTLDLLTRLPNVRLAGSVTAQDTIFIEPTVQRLPSNYADLSYGHKAWTTRARANNTPFTPAAGLAYTGVTTDEAAVRTWVGTLF